MPNRRDLLALVLLSGAAPPLLRHALGADVPRFALGIASGQPQASGVVLWTRLTGAGLPPRVDVAWEVAHDEAFTRIAARGTETALLEDAHCVHAEAGGLEPARWYWYRFSALGQRSPVGRTRTAPAADAVVTQFNFAIASCQRWDTGFFAAWRHAAAEPLDLVMFLGDYIYEYNSGRDAVRPLFSGPPRTLAQYRERYALHKSDAELQAAHAACPWLLVWDDHEVENDYAALQGNRLEPDFAAQRAAAYQAYWEHMPLPKSARPLKLDAGAEMRMFGRLDWGRLARIHLLDDRQMRDVQACPKPGRGGSNTVRLKDCPDLLDPKRSLLGATQERWLADGWDSTRPWNLLAQQTLMARLSRDDPAGGGGRYWTDGWDGYAPARQRLLDGVAAKKLPGAVVLGGDVHGNYVADLKTDFDDAKAPVVASEFCGTSITSLSMAQARLDAILPFNPHMKLARSERRGYMHFSVGERQLQVRLRSLLDARDAASGIETEARFAVELGRPGPQRV
jgi:alkaline phosphatase D